MPAAVRVCIDGGVSDANDSKVKHMLLDGSCRLQTIGNSWKNHNGRPSSMCATRLPNESSATMAEPAAAQEAAHAVISLVKFGQFDSEEQMTYPQRHGKINRAAVQ